MKDLRWDNVLTYIASIYLQLTFTKTSLLTETTYLVFLCPVMTHCTNPARIPQLDESNIGPGDEPGAAAGLRPGPAEGGAGDHDPGEPGQAAAPEDSEFK